MIDIAVHSLKDVETLRDARFCLGAMLERADPRDRLVVRDGIAAATIADLPPGARLGTSSPRRAAQVKRIRPDLDTVLLRGNVATRLAKIAAGDADATLLARSEEHTSELQSLMRTSYAVFCLKIKMNHVTQLNH